MAKKLIEAWGYLCERCGHEWVPRDEDVPRICPKCKSPYWDRPPKSQHPAVAILRSMAQTPDTRMVNVEGTFMENGRSRPFHMFYRPRDVTDSEFNLPAGFTGTFKVWGDFAFGVTPLKKNVVEDVNRIRKFAKLEPLPEGVECDSVDSKGRSPVYCLVLLVPSTGDQSKAHDS